MYKIGDKILYPMHGVGTIDGIEKKTVLGHRDEYYMISIASSGMKVMVPVKNSASVGIRPLIAKTKVRDVLHLLGHGETEIELDWKLRLENNTNKMKTGDIMKAAEVTRDLYRRGLEKELSFFERKLYESAYTLLTNEIAMSRGLSVEDAGNIVSEALSANRPPAAAETIPPAAVPKSAR